MHNLGSTMTEICRELVHNLSSSEAEIYGACDCALFMQNLDLNL